MLSQDAKAFVDWARQCAVPASIPLHDDTFHDLQGISNILGDKRMVALGESAHYLHEWNRYRARLFKYLVQHHGFTTFVLESGLVEGKNLYDYVLGADIDFDRVINSVTNAWGVWAELQDLLIWMREYNAATVGDPPLRFYCMDGSGNWAHTEITVDSLKTYLEQVDEPLWQEFEWDLGVTARGIHFDDRAEVTEQTWQLVLSRSTLLISRLEQNRLAYIERSSAEAFDWAFRAAKVLEDLLLVFCQTHADMTIGFPSFWNTRDVAMAEQLQWIIGREGERAGIVIGAHNTHLQRYPVRVEKATSMGSYLVQDLGRDSILFIGASNAYSVRGEEPEPDSNQAVYQQIGEECFLLDLRQAPQSGPVRRWLQQERKDRSNLRYQPVALCPAWDCLLFHRTVRIAQPRLPSDLQRGHGRADTHRFDDFAGHYLLHGFLGYPTKLSIFRQHDELFADGRYDLSGELFPPFASRLHATDDGGFGWSNWPAYLRFLGQGQVQRIELSMPGIGDYVGVRMDPGEYCAESRKQV